MKATSNEQKTSHSSPKADDERTVRILIGGFMRLNHIDIMIEGIELSKDCTEKIQQTAAVTKKVSVSAEV